MLGQAFKPVISSPQLVWFRQDLRTVDQPALRAAAERGPVVATVNARSDRNAIGAHGGSYSIYRALAISSGAMDPQARPDLNDTSPVCEIGPHKQWADPSKIVSLDPWGHRVAQDFGNLIAEGLDVRPSIAEPPFRLVFIATWGVTPMRRQPSTKSRVS